LRDAGYLSRLRTNATAWSVEGENQMSQRDQTFVPLTRRETAQRTAAAFAVVVMVFLALMAIQPA
jgi:hypothetical protein